MGTLEKSQESHEFGTVRKRFAKNRDFHFRTAPDHGNLLRKRFGAKIADPPQIRKNERVLVPIVVRRSTIFGAILMEVRLQRGPKPSIFVDFSDFDGFLSIPTLTKITRITLLEL